MPDSFSFPPTARLTKPEEFRQVFKKSKKYFFKEITVYCHRQNLDNSRLGLAVSKKVDKRAVTRNKIKRIIRESFRFHQKQLTGWDIVVVAKPAINNLTNQQLSELLTNVWKELQCVN